MPDSDDVQQRIEHLREVIRRHNRLYFVENVPEISDREFDALMDELQRLEREHPDLLTPDSPTQRVGGEPLSEFTSATHPSPMYSIDNTYNEVDVREFDARIGRLLGENAVWSYVVEPKIDGAAINLVYRNGLLERAITRGNGTVGDDVTQNARTVREIPLRLQADGVDFADSRIEVRGEIYMSFSAFERLNREREEAGEQPFANPRNATAGSLKLLDPRIVAGRRLCAFTYGVRGNLSLPDSYWEHLAWLRHCGCPVNPECQSCKNVNEVVELCEDWQSRLHELGYPADGLVIKVDSVEQRKRLGFTAKFPRWMMAYKFAAEQQVSQVLDIEVDVGKTGQLTPVALLDPVQLSGTVVKRASLHNFDELDRKGVRVGDYVLVEKAGEIIPQVVKVIEEKRTGEEKPVPPPDVCPACGSPVRREESDKKKCLDAECPGANHLKGRGYLPIEEDECEVCGGPVRVPGRRKAHKVCENPSCSAYGRERLRSYLRPERDVCSDCGGPVTVAFFLFCDNPACPAQRVQRIAHYGSKAAMDIDGLGEATVELLSERGLVSGVVDLYSLKDRREEAESIDGLGKISVDNLLKGIEASKRRGLDRLIFAIGIPNVGSHLAGVLAGNFADMQALEGADKEALKAKGEIGTRIAEEIHGFFRLDSTRSLLAGLRAAGVSMESERRAVAENPDVAGKTFVLTGTLEGYTRDEATRLIESQGGRVTGGVSGKTDYVVAGAEPGSKLEKARKLDRHILSEEDFKKLTGGPDPD